MEKYIQVNGIKLHVIEEGPKDGEVIIFLHGFPECWYSWKKQIPFFAQQKFRVLAPDQRGYNLSDKPANVKAYHIRNLVADIVGLIKSTGKERVYLVGHDWGGAVAWKVAEAYPDLVYKLVILNMPHPKVFKKVLRSSLRQCLLSSYIFFAQIPWLPEKILQLTDYKILTQAMKISSIKPAFSDQTLEKYKRSWKRKGSMHAMINWYRAAKYSREPKENVRIKVPVLLIWGNQERFFIKEAVDDSLAICEEAVLCKTKGSHWLQHEKPEELNKQILNYIRKSL